MKASVFYFSMNPGPDRYPVYLGRNAVIPIGYVRAELHEGSDENALDKANPQSDESVMNSHEIPDPPAAYMSAPDHFDSVRR